MSSEMNDESIVVAGRPPKKLALLIGNNNYEHGDKLKYCINDVHDVANELKQMGFQVTIGTDLPYVTMIQIILRFQRQINTDDLVVFFYSGHGIQWEDQNYLIAIDNKCLADDTEMYRHYAIRVQFILESMTKRRPSTIVFLLDCCRTYLTENQALSNTPLTKSIPENTTRTGLTTMKGVAGSLIVFACGPNEAVLEESKNGRNSIFTYHLLKHIVKPNLKIDELMCHVCNDMFEDTNGQSCCYRLSSLRTPNVYFNALNEGEILVKHPMSSFFL
ncbi:unnamed protein product [Rotaria sp. Silwood1]|nr:unnamed protein product [Rotaria sp. Silwood1]